VASETITPASSWINEFTYDPDTYTLVVRIAGKAHTHDGVPQSVWDELKNAGSPGQFYTRNIKGQF
jgi:hypothetical protein